MRKRILAWAALLFFLLIVINMMFIHYRVTETLTIFLLYVLFFFFYSKRQSTAEYTDFSGTGENNGIPDETDENTGDGTDNNQ